MVVQEAQSGLRSVKGVRDMLGSGGVRDILGSAVEDLWGQ